MAVGSSNGGRTTGRSRRSVQVVVLLAALVVNLYWATPSYNFDMLVYIVAAYRFGGASRDAAHEGTYRAAREAVPPQQYALLTGSTTTGSSGYRRILASDPAALEQQLPAYTVKPVYPALVLLLERAGVHPVHATILISQVAYLLTGMVVLLWLAPLLSPLAALVTAFGVMSLRFVLDLGRLSTPDALSTFVVLAALLLVFERRRFAAGASLLVVSLAVRPDNLLWLLAVAAYGAVWLRRSHAAAGCLVAGIAVYFGLTTAAGYYGWATQFHGSLVELIAYPRSFEPMLSPFEYVWIYLRETHPANLPSFILVFVLIGSWLGVYRQRRFGWRDTGVALLVAAGVFVALHWLVYPGDERFLPAAYIAVLLLLIQTLVTELKEAAVRTRPPLVEAQANHPERMGSMR